MTNTRSASRAFYFSALTGILLACSPAPATSGTRGNNGGGSSTGNGGSNNVSGGTSTGQGGSGVTLSQGGNTSSGGGDPTAGATCAATTETAKLVPLDLYILMDSSKSMNEVTSTNVTKWKAVTDALKGFFGDANSVGMNIALKFFPDEQSVPGVCTSDGDCGSFGPCAQRKACVTKGTFSKQITMLCNADTDCTGTNEMCAPVQRCVQNNDCTTAYNCVSGGSACPTECVPFTGYCDKRDVCSATSYATPAVPFATLPDAATGLNAALNARMPDGYTPTGPALTGALQAARARAKAEPGHKVSAILVTDGLPGGYIPGKPPAECTPADIAGVSTVLSTGNSMSADGPAIQTFVIGVFGPCDLRDQNTMPQANLDKWAASGGTNKAVVINTNDNVQQQLQDALKMVRTSAIACQYAVPKSESGVVDLMKVNVRFSSGGANTTVYYVGTKDKCDATRGGWYYDQDPMNGGKPTQIVVCDQSCSQFQAKQDGRVDIALGCATEIIK